jgi:predicted Zn finger-like uncharacterized protein
MDVRCERCRAQYAVDDARVSEAGVAVTCVQCGHAFLLRKKVLAVTVPLKGPAAEGARPVAYFVPGASPPGAGSPVGSDAASEWRMRQAGGAVYPFRELSTLQRWIVERKAGRGDEVASADGGTWRRLEDIPELQSFFAVVDRAERRAEAQPSSSAEPVPGGAIATGAEDPAWARGPVAPARRITRSALRPVKPRRRVIWLVLLVVGLVGVAAATYVLRYRADREAAAAAAREQQQEARPTPASAAREPARPASPAAQAPAPPPAPATATAPAPATATGPATGAAGEQPSAPAGAPAEPVRVAAPVVAVPDAAGSVVPRAAAPRPSQGADPAATLRSLLSRARDQRERGRCESALDLYGQALAIDGRNAAALAGRGACYLDLSRYVQAEASFEAALEADPRNADALYGMAETYRYMGRKPEAVAFYERFLAVRSTGDDAAAARRLVSQLKE